MKCEKCGNEMKNLGLALSLGRRSLGKRFYKLQCENTACSEYGKVKYVKLSEYFKKTQ